MRQEGVLADYHAIRPRGMTIKGVTSSSDRIAGITVTADSVEEFNEKHRRIVTAVKILDCDGRDIMRHDLLPDLR